MAAVGRPQMDYHRKVEFDGRIGIWPFIEEVPSQRDNKNRPAGTMEKKSIAVDRDVVRMMLVDNVIPAIREKFPNTHKKMLFIQQDNATPHVPFSDGRMRYHLKKDGWNMKLVQQPANSPDYNVLDLGFFNAVQSLQYKTVINSVNDLIKATTTAFGELESRVLDNTWISFQKAMEMSTTVGGGNNYKLAHKNLSKPVRNIVCDPQLIDECNNIIRSNK